VPLAQYVAFMSVLGQDQPLIDAARVADGFAHLVVAPEMLDQLGPAINARRAVFLYGAPGNGKSVMGDCIGRALGGSIYVPTALDIDGEIVTVFDPVTHVRTEAPEEGIIVRADDEVDARWVRVRRPVITVGGELTLEVLDLRFNPLAGFYDAPFQLKANGGVLVVDDFGRQRVAAKDLLNRWVVPLESRVDYLGLHTGRKFQVPFDVMVVFATNLDPAALADEAFLRRIPYKVLAKDPSPDQFSRIFAMNCRRHGVEFDQDHVDHLYSRYYLRRQIPVRACHPRDLLDQIAAMCRYHGRSMEISTELLDAACATYFLDDGDRAQDLTQV
jgi:SpoVK/Ycf46/Vps4 family AAA+-type ATPase